MAALGDFAAGTVVQAKFTTVRPSSGAPYTLAGTPVLSVYKDNSTTQSTTGVSLTVDFDSVTGLNHFAVNTAADATFYSNGSFFDVVVTTGTVDGVSVVGQVVASFTVQAGYSSGGGGGGTANVNVVQWNGTSVAAPTVAGVPKVEVSSISNNAITPNTFSTSTGLRPLTSGTAQGGSAYSITLAASESSTTDLYRRQLVVITGGTGAGQAKPTTGYDGTTKVLTIASAWVTNPDATSTYAVLSHGDTPGDIAWSVWDENLSDHTIAGSTGKAIADLPSTAQINAEVVDALSVDTYAEPGQGVPAATTTLAAKINYIYKALRNKVTQTASTFSLFADDGTTVDQKATVSDDGTTFTRGELGSGP